MTDHTLPHETLAAHDGMVLFEKMMAGDLPGPAMARTLNFALIEIEEGRAKFAGTPTTDFYNPIGTVHAGWALTVLDSACACAVHSTLAAGEGYTTLELKTNLVRAVTTERGELYGEGSVLYRGGRIATAEAKLTDGTGKLYAHATSTCLIFPMAETPGK